MSKKVFIWSLILLYLGLPFNHPAQVVRSKDEAIRSIRDNFISRNSEFEIFVDRGSLMQLLEGIENIDFLDAATAIDDKDTSADADYLKASVISWTAAWSILDDNTAKLNFAADYRTTKEQEEELEREIEAALASLDIGNATDYEKIKLIHDYIVELAVYDQSLTRYSAYNVFVDKSAVCLGYAAAAYRMFTDAGIESRIIAGIADSQQHVWNIVKLDGVWYNIDLTWDDPIGSNGESLISYDFFLKNMEDFICHERAPEYSTEEFMERHMMAEDSFSLQD